MNRISAAVDSPISRSLSARHQCADFHFCRAATRRLNKGAGLSVDGLARPCSCPASERSWQGALKTRSTPCLRTSTLQQPLFDIGKNSFHVAGLDSRGAIVLRQKWSRGQVEARPANMPPCLIGMEVGESLNRREGPEGNITAAAGSHRRPTLSAVRIQTVAHPSAVRNRRLARARR